MEIMEAGDMEIMVGTQSKENTEKEERESEERRVIGPKSDRTLLDIEAGLLCLCGYLRCISHFKSDLTK